MEKKLKLVCVLIWIAVIAAASTLIIQIASKRHIEVCGNNNVVIVSSKNVPNVKVEGDCNTVVVEELVDRTDLLLERAYINRNFISRKNASALKGAIEFWAHVYSIPLEFAYALVEAESDFVLYPGVNYLGFVGNCQIGQAVIDEFNKANKRDVTLNEVKHSFYTNIEVGFWYYSRLKDTYGANFGIHTWRDAYIAYNLGPTLFARNPYFYKFESTKNKKSRERFYKIISWWETKL